MREDECSVLVYRLQSNCNIGGQTPGRRLNYVMGEEDTFHFNCRDAVPIPTIQRRRCSIPRPNEAAVDHEALPACHTG